MAPYMACPYRTVDEEVDYFMGELRVKPDLPVIIAEGTLDALNLPNSIAVNGINKITEEFIRRMEYRYGENIIYALDNEVIDLAARSKVKELLLMEKQVFMWGELAKDVSHVKNIKDFNQLCCTANQTEIPLHTILKYTRKNISAIL